MNNSIDIRFERNRCSNDENQHWNANNTRHVH
jgi:hypothetical protein